MTTAHRPTFDAARGRESLRGPAYHQRLLPAHTALKHRQAGQGGSGGLKDGQAEKRDLRAELLMAEKAARRARKGEIAEKEEDHEAAATTTGEKRKAEMLEGGSEEHSGEGEDAEAEAKRRRLILQEAHDIDADTSSSESEGDEGNEGHGKHDNKDESSDSDSSSESDSDDEEEKLQRELAKIKAERAAAKAAEEAKLASEQQEQREEEIALGNPLLNKRDFSVRRRWDDDVVFKNQARGSEDKGAKEGRFVNDLLRSDFHRKFMGRYVR